MWAFANMVTNNVAVRDVFAECKLLVIAEEKLSSFQEFYSHQAKRFFLTLSFFRLVASFFRVEPYRPLSEHLIYARSLFEAFLNPTDAFSEIDMSLLSYFNIITLIGEDKDLRPYIQEFGEDFANKLCFVIEKSAASNVLEAVRVVTNLTGMAEDFYTDIFSNTRLLEITYNLLRKPPGIFHAEAIGFLSNIYVSGSVLAKRALQDSDLMVRVLEIFSKSKELENECLVCFRNYLSNSEDLNVGKFALDNDFILDVVMDRVTLQTKSNYLVKICMIIKSLLYVGQNLRQQKITKENFFLARIETSRDFVDKLTDIQEHKDPVVVEAFQKLVSEFFDYVEKEFH